MPLDLGGESQIESYILWIVPLHREGIEDLGDSYPRQPEGIDA